MASVIAAIALAGVGVACAAYGLWFVFGETKMRFHFFWLALGAALVVPAVLMAAGLWDSVPIVLRWVLGLAFLLFATYEIVACAVVARHCNDEAAVGLDYVVVLGAQVLGANPGRTFRQRLDAALGYLSENPHARCIVCGAQGRGETVPEAHAGRDYLVENGIDRNRILLEFRSYSTAQNLRNAAALIDSERDAVGIVTSDYHVARSLAIARKAGIGHVSGIAVESLRSELPYNIVRETFAWAKDFLAGNA